MRHDKIILILIAFMFLISSVSGALSDVNSYAKHLYENVTDGVFNQSKWINTTSVSGGGTASFTESASNYLVLNIQDAGAGTSLGNFNTSVLPNITLLKAVRFNVSLETTTGGGGSASSSLNIFGTKIASVSGTASDRAIWLVIANNSNASRFDIWRNTVFNRTIVPVNNVVNYNCSAIGSAGPDTATCFVLLRTIDYYDNLGLEITNPANNSYVVFNPVHFNATVIPGVNLTLVNSTVRVFNATGGVYATNTTARSGTAPQNISSIFALDNVGRYYWNYEIWATNGSNNYQFFSPANYTFIRGYSFNNVTYTPSVSDNSLSTYTLNISVDSTQINFASATLYYDGTAYATTSAQTGNEYIFSTTIEVPTVTSVTNKSFYFTVFLSDTTISEYSNTSLYNQTVSPINFSICGTGARAVNYTIYDEDTLSPITADFDGQFYYSLNETLTTKNYSYSSTGASSYTFCINTNATYYVNALIELSKTGYTTRLYQLANEQYNNVTTNRSLYLLNENSSSDVVIQLKDEGQQALSGYTVKIYRNFPTGYQMVEEKVTDQFGEFVSRLVENTVQYKFEFYDSDGNLKATKVPVYIVCYTTRCNIPFILREESNPLSQFINIEDHDYNLVFNNGSNTFVLAWADSTGDLGVTHTLRVLRISGNSSFVVCNNQSTTLISSLNCPVGDGRYTYIAQGFRSTTGGDNVLLATLGAIVSGTVSSFGKTALFWVLIFLLTIGTAVLLTAGIVPAIVLMCGGLMLFAFAGIIQLSIPVMIGIFAIGGFFAWAFRT